MRYQHPALLVSCMVLVLLACKKDEEDTPPSVSISAPAAGSTVNIPDTLAVTVTASDDERVERITVTIVDANGVPVTTGQGSSPLTNPATVTITLPVTSEQVTSGNYTLVATASDGALTSRDSRPVTLIAAPFRLRAVFAVTTTSPNAVSLYRIDSVGQVALAGNFPMDLGGAAINSRTQLLYVAGSVTGALQAIAPGDLGVRWQQPNLGTLGAPYFSAVTAGSDERLYTGTGDGRLRGYDAGSGTQVFAADLTSNFRVAAMTVVDGQVIAAERNLVTQQYHLARYQQASGTSIDAQVLDKTPIALFPRDADHALIFGNRDGQGVVEDRYLPLGGGWEPHSWAAEITAVVRISTDAWIVALANGDLERFTYTDAGSIGIGSGPVLTALAWDAAHGAVLAGSDGVVRSIDPQNGNVIASYPVGGTVYAVLPLFNRAP